MHLHWGSRHALNCRVGEKNSDNGFNFDYYTGLLTRPRAIRGLLWFPYGPLKHWFEIDCQIFLQKGVLFRISKELQYWELQWWWATRRSLHGKARRTLYGGRRKLGGLQKVKSPRLFIAESLPGKQMSCSCSCWVLPWLLGVAAVASGLSALFSWGFCWLIIHSTQWIKSA